MAKPNEYTNPPGSPDGATPRIPDHRLLRVIGRGSYGEVWLALNAMNKWTAVKIVRRGAEDDSRAYEQEFRGLRRYDDLSGSDGSLMPIKNVGQNAEAGFFYYAMELADDAGTRQPLPRPPTAVDDLDAVEQLATNYRPWTLSEELKRHGRLTAHDCIEHGLALAESLHVLHQGGLVHRDVKPSNIIFVNGRPKLADVGLVAATDATMNSFAGTSGFAPLHGSGEPTGDIFALGKVLYMAATGHDVLHFPRAIPDFDKLPDDERQKIAELQAVYEKACDPLPEDRHPSAQVLRDELEMLHRNGSVLRLRKLEEERTLFEKLRQANRRRRKRLVTYSVIVSAVAIVAVITSLDYKWRLRTAHEATVAALEAGQLSRMLARPSGWSIRGWDSVRRAAVQSLDEAVIRQAVSTLIGPDASIISQWENVESSSAAFAPDGKVLFASFGTNRAMLITDATNRTELPVIGEGQACWSLDGEPLIWQMGSNVCVLREARTGNVRRNIPLAPGEKVVSENTPVMAVTPDGALLAAAFVGTNGSRVVVWDARNGRMVGEAAGSFRAVSFTPDGTLIAAGDEHGKTTIWSTSPFSLIAELPPGKRPNPITCLAFGEDRVVSRAGQGETKRWLLAVGDSGAGIVIWDLTKRLPRAFCAGSYYNIQSLAFSPDGLTLASAGRGDVWIWDVMSGALLLLVGGVGSSDTTALAFDSTGNFVAVGANASSAPCGVALVAFNQHRGVQRLRGLNYQVRKVWISPDSRMIAALSDDWSLAVWETESGRLRHLFEAPAGVLADNAGGAFDATGKRFGFAAGRNAQLYDLESGRTLSRWSLPHGFGEEIQFDSEGRLLLVRRERHPETWRWILYELPIGRAAAVLHQQEDFSYRPISMAFPVPGSQFIAIAQDRATGMNSVRAFEVGSGRQRWQVEQHRHKNWDLLQISAGGRWCGFGVGPQNLMQVVGITNGTLKFSFKNQCLAISPDGRSYAMRGKATDQWLLWTRGDAEGPTHFGFDGNYIDDTFAFSSDGLRIGWGTTDGTVFLADILTVRQRLNTLRHSEKR